MSDLGNRDVLAQLRTFIAEREDLLSLLPTGETLLSPTKYTQTFKEEYELLAGKRVSGLPLAEMNAHRNYQTDLALRKLHRRLARAVIWGLGDSYCDELLGLMEIMRRLQEDRWNPYTYRDMDSHPVGIEDIDELLYRLYRHNDANYSHGDWRVVAGPRIVAGWYWGSLLPIHRPGPDVRQFYIDSDPPAHQRVQSKLGVSLPIVVDENMRPDVVMVLNTRAFSYGFVGSELQIRTVEKRRTVETKELSFQAYGLVPSENPRSNLGVLYNVSAPEGGDI